MIPCYNEADRLDVSVLHRFLINNDYTSLFIVNDGSLDNTLTKIVSLKNSIPRELSSRVTVVDLKNNVGKENAVREGVLQALACNEYDWIGFWDADLSTPLDEVANFREIAESNSDYAMITGARILKMGSNINRRWYRHYLGRIFATLISKLIGLPYYDTQCGAKLFRNDIISVVFSSVYVSKWFFDVEIILRLKRSSTYIENSNCIYELPLNSWIDVSGSKLSFVDFLKAPFELLKIWRNYRN